MRWDEVGWKKEMSEEDYKCRKKLNILYASLFNDVDKVVRKIKKRNEWDEDEWWAEVEQHCVESRGQLARAK